MIQINVDRPLIGYVDRTVFIGPQSLKANAKATPRSCGSWGPLALLSNGLAALSDSQIWHQVSGLATTPPIVSNGTVSSSGADNLAGSIATQHSVPVSILELGFANVIDQTGRFCVHFPYFASKDVEVLVQKARDLSGLIFEAARFFSRTTLAFSVNQLAPHLFYTLAYEGICNSDQFIARIQTHRAAQVKWRNGGFVVIKLRNVDLSENVVRHVLTRRTS
jgi:hypothetical protein